MNVTISTKITNLQDPDVTAVAPGRDTIFLATSKGVIKEFDSSFRLVQSFVAYSEPDWNITHLVFLEGTSLLMTVASKTNHPLTAHLWNLDKIDKQSNGPHCHTTITVMNGSNTFPLSAFCISSDHSILGFGYADGTVILVRGDIVRDRGSRQRVVYRSNTPVTGLEFYEGDENGSVVLMIATVSQILTVPTTGRNSGKPDIILDKKGAALGCVTMVKGYRTQKDRLAVARDGEIAYYTPVMRGASIALDLPKKSIYSFGHYFLVTSILSADNSSVEASNSFSNFVGADTTRIFIIDTLNNFIAYTEQMAAGIKFIFTQWDKLHVLGSDGILYVFKEKDIDTRLAILKTNNLYDIAIELSTKMDLERNKILRLEREYADFLYKGDQSAEALEHYITSIELGQTSEVILKYRDSQKIDYLTRYLEALHSEGVATKQHTTLLFNSYAKLNNLEKLTQFVEGSQNKESIAIDYETAIRICCQAGYFTLAVYLAQRSGDTDLAVQIKLRDLKDYKGCLEYIRSLDVTDALRILIQFSRELLDTFPVETTALLVSLFTGKFSPTETELDINARREIQPQTFEGSSDSITAPVLQSYRALVNYMSNVGSNAPVGSDDASHVNGRSIPTYQPPRPRLIFSSFIDHPNEFVIFLEECLESYDKFEANEKDRADLLSTLFEMYLTLSRKATDHDTRHGWESKARSLAMTSKTHIDHNTILLLSHLASYHDGKLLAWDAREGYEVDLFRACIASGNVQEAIEILHKYGEHEHELFPLALNFFISSPSVLEEAGEEFDYVLKKIKEEQIMTPLQVIQTISVNSVATIGHIRQYLVDIIDAEKQDIDRHTKLAESYRSETRSKQEQISKILNDPSIVQYTVCASCGSALDLPVVHFSCKHSYHQRCLANNLIGSRSIGGSEEPVCPRCLPELENIRAIRRSHEDVADRNDLFEIALHGSDNKFKVVTDFISRGALTG
ncbi:tethering complex subunit PEP5 [Sugiyamaella lignohabitans]|uniref:E3 ubiquitin-protein ligase PEP5 n=1 Tax=Sugiyamaella lignohabitans TaxID=796027 RepID=A0A167C3E8_9ASCO|nr:tethering complex subunit PEP5 [Sugiyamaella lignohabitans]ANB11170.1 tethering complex subunit PEP5 [Sugiyamaella lignohabitans]